MKLTAKIMDFSNGKSASGRVYDLDALKEAVETFNKSGNKFGYFADDRERYMIGDNQIKGEMPIYEAATKVVGDLRFDNETVVGEVELLDTPRGNIAKMLMEHNIDFKFAPAMLIQQENELDADGNPVLDENGEPKKIVTHAEIVGVDIVKQ